MWANFNLSRKNGAHTDSSSLGEKAKEKEKSQYGKEKGQKQEVRVPVSSEVSQSPSSNAQDHMVVTVSTSAVWECGAKTKTLVELVERT